MKINVLKKDAKVNVEVTPAHLHRIQQLAIYIGKDKTKEEIDEISKIIEANQPEKLEHWMQLLVFITGFMAEIEKKAVAEGQTYEKEIDDNADLSQL